MINLLEILKCVELEELEIYFSTENDFKFIIFKIINKETLPKDICLSFLDDFDMYVIQHPKGRHIYEWSISFKENNGNQYTEYSINDKVLGDIVSGIREYNIDNILND